MKIALLSALFVLVWFMIYMNTKGLWTDKPKQEDFIVGLLRRYFEWIYRTMDACWLLKKQPMTYFENLTIVNKYVKAKENEGEDERQTRIHAAIIRFIVFSLVIVLGIIGFFLPSEYSKYDKMATIHEISELNEQGEYNKAVILAERTRKFESPMFYYQIGKAYLNTHNYTMAETVLGRAVDLLPNFAAAHEALGQVYKATGKVGEAITEAERVKEYSGIQISPDALLGLQDDPLGNVPVKLLFSALFIAIAFGLPCFLLKLYRDRRNRKYDDQLADGLFMVASFLRVMNNIENSFKEVGQKSPSPLGEEFRALYDDYYVSNDLDFALGKLAERLPSVENKIFIQSVKLRKATTKLYERFDTIAKTILERKRVLNKIKTMTTDGETQAFVLAIMPVIMFYILSKMNPEVYSLLYTTNWGWVILVICAVVDVFGLWLMLKIVRVQV